MAEPQDSSRLKKAALVLLVGYWLAFFLATHTPVPHAVLPRHSDKLLHFAGYAGLAFLLCFNWSLRRTLGWRHGIGILALLAACAALDEVTQIPVGRQCDFLDWIADVIGAAAGLAAFGAASALNFLPAWRPRRA